MVPQLEDKDIMVYGRYEACIPSGSRELLPSSKTLSVGKVITWSGPAMAIGGLLFSLQRSHDISLWQGIRRTIPINNNMTINMNFLFIIKD